MKRFVVKQFVVLLVAITPMIVHADKQFTQGKGGTWDCTKDPVVSINHGQGSYKLSGKCKTVSINGGENKLTIESVDTLNVLGGSNAVTIGTADAINVTGSDNKITYKAAKSDKVKTQSMGNNNTIAQAR